MDLYCQLFGSGDFISQGYCYLWNPSLVWLHVISDTLIAMAYFAIPFTLIWFVRKRQGLPSVFQPLHFQEEFANIRPSGEAFSIL